MAKWTINCSVMVIFTRLLFISAVSALTIDNQLTVVTNDCFERLAIGQKLSSKDIYNKLELNTVPDCQRECTKDGDTCRSFSFGIGIKGNASCDLSNKVIKETVDLKPIGTIPDEDYDLYIKKLGCKLVIEQNPPTTTANIPQTIQHDEIASSDGYSDNTKDIPTTHNSYIQNPASDNYGSESDNYRPVKPEPVFRPDNSYEIHKPRPQHSPDPHNVHTSLISIRPDPNRPSYTGLGPAIGLFDSSRPESTITSYKPRPDDDYYDNRKYSRPQSDYDFDRRPIRPYDDRTSNYNSPRPLRPYIRPMHETRPVMFEPQPYDVDRYEKPDDHYNRPSYYDEKPYFRPGIGEYDPGPIKPRPPMDDTSYTNEIPNPEFHRPRPNRPEMYDDSLTFNFDRPNKRPGIHYNRPVVNKFQSERPRPMYDDLRPNYNRPVDEYEKPYGMDDDKRRPIQEFDHRPLERPRPNRYEITRPPPEYSRPEYERPEYTRPHDRPYVDDRPRPEYDNRPFNEPLFETNRPLNDYNGPIDKPEPNLNRPKPNYGNNYQRPTSHIPNRPYDPSNPNMPYPDTLKPVTEDTDNRRGGYYNEQKINGTLVNNVGDLKKPAGPHDKPMSVITETVGPNGQTIVSIVTEIEAMSDGGVRLPYSSLMLLGLFGLICTSFLSRRVLSTTLPTSK